MKNEMTEEQMMLKEIQMAIAAMPLDKQMAIEVYANLFRRVTSCEPEISRLAMALVGSELAAEEAFLP